MMRISSFQSHSQKYSHFSEYLPFQSSFLFSVLYAIFFSCHFLIYLALLPLFNRSSSKVFVLKLKCWICSRYSDFHGMKFSRNIIVPSPQVLGGPFHNKNLWHSEKFSFNWKTLPSSLRKDLFNNNYFMNVVNYDKNILLLQLKRKPSNL